MLFDDFATRLLALEGTSSRLAMTEILAGLFREAKPDEARMIAYLLSGRIAPQYEAREFNLADKTMISAISVAYGVDPESVRNTFRKLGDLGSTAQALYGKGLFHDENIRPSLKEVFSVLEEIAGETGSGSKDRKISLLAELLGRVTPQSARFLVRIPLDKLRLGFSDMTVLDALSWMEGGDKSLRGKLEDCYNRRPDIGFIVSRVREKGIGGLSEVKVEPGVPVLAALCQRLPTADEMVDKMGEVAVEPKYDGVRVQIHYQKVNSKELIVNSFSRNLENTTAMFTELDEAVKQINAKSVILDAEAVGLDPKTGKLIPFQETVTRKRKHGVAAARKNVPLKFFVFDILYKDGQDLLSHPLSVRRKILNETVKPGKILVISPQIVTASAGKLREFHDQQLKKGLEGAVVKKWVSPYEPGRRGYSWVKFKEAEGRTGKLNDTIDCVVMGYYTGEGKRSHLGIGAFLVGVRYGETFLTVSKIGTGVSDDQWLEIKNLLKKYISKDKPGSYGNIDKSLVPDLWTDPRVVVEIAGDDLTKSPTHDAGYAIRFPRLVRIRADKSGTEATTLHELKKMYELQGAAKGAK